MSSRISPEAERGDAGGPARRSALELAREVLRIEAAALVSLAERFDAAAFDRALDILLGCSGRVVVSGMGKSGIIARKLAGTLASTGSPALFLHPAEAGHGDLGMLIEGDALIAISQSGDTQEVVGLLPAVKRLGVPVIAIVGASDSTLGREADVTLDAAVEKEACPLGLIPTASTTAALAVGDALAMALLEERGFSADDLAVHHPRGSLGRQLLRVHHVMHTADDIPAVAASAGIREVLAQMSAKGLGMTLVLDEQQRLAGVITDGDLRRLVEQSGETALERGAAEWMTRNPVCIRADALATEALRLMEERRITSLPVIDGDRRPQGVVHLHDLWRTEMI
ncbi:MAG: KpsF/GutQ family sugar-phosphate isomerase [Acidobacteriota bacterium]|jgi:arabinose-5-phosphate isomerase